MDKIDYGSSGFYSRINKNYGIDCFPFANSSYILIYLYDDNNRIFITHRFQDYELPDFLKVEYLSSNFDVLNKDILIKNIESLIKFKTFM